MTLDPNMMAIAIIIIALVAIAFFLHLRRHQSHVLEKHFGPEYERAVNEYGSRPKAERELMRRKERVEKLDIVPLTREDAQRFGEEWRALQARFVDNPKGSLADADALVRELMTRRGYPMADFEHRAADISVHYPSVVDHYRSAHDIAVRDRTDGVDTEAMRQAVIHYRALFSELLEVERPREARQAERDMRGATR
jgi:hypothetical protein